MQKFVAIHKHEYGTSVRVFASIHAADTIFNRLPNPEFGDDEQDPDTGLTRRDFARRLNLDFEPEKGEELTVEVLTTGTDVLEFTEFLDR